MDTLNEIRAKWETGKKVPILVIPHDESQALCVVLKEQDGGEEYYDLNRYYLLGDAWHCSVDVRTSKDLPAILATITEMFADTTSAMAQL